MANKLPGPVTVTDPGAARQTIIASNGLQVGRKVTARAVVRPGAFGGGVAVPPGGGVATGDTQPRVPDVNVDIGDAGGSGGITIRDKSDNAVISLNGESGLLTLGTGKGAAGSLMLRSDKNGPVILATGKEARIVFMDARLKQTMVIDGLRGDIELIGADCAEDFDMAEPADAGAVLCVDDDGHLHPCRADYDRRVVGVLSGAGGFRPGLRLDRRGSSVSRQPLALIGKVSCWVDADRGPVRVGELLTSSATEGHAMRADNADRAFGAVLGKSLASLDRGRALIPILVALQ